jgi:predicted Fe-Mo cluster-binding NifX family protein
MADQISTPRVASRIAVTVMELRSGSGPVPCPFFGKCDGIVVHVADTDAREFHRNPPRTPQSLCDLLLATGVDGLICGTISDLEIRRLRAAGIDVRLGSGRYSVDELVACFCDLPAA